MQIKIHFCKGLIYGKIEREVMITCSCTWCFHSDKRVPAGLEQSLVICYINLSSLYIKSLIFWNNFQKKSFSRLKTAYTYNKNPYWIEHIWLVHSKNPYPLLIWVRDRKGLFRKILSDQIKWNKNTFILPKVKQILKLDIWLWFKLTSR